MTIMYLIFILQQPIPLTDAVVYKSLRNFSKTFVRNRIKNEGLIFIENISLVVFSLIFIQLQLLNVKEIEFLSSIKPLLGTLSSILEFKKKLLFLIFLLLLYLAF